MPVDAPSDVSPELIDSLIDSLPTGIPVVEEPEKEGYLPPETDVRRMAEDLGCTVKSGVRDEDSTGITIPEFYSLREERHAIARGVAKLSLAKISSNCRESDPNTSVCTAAQDPDPGLIDHLAAAILMPTGNLRHWGERVGWEERKLASLFCVPVSVARIRSQLMKRGDLGPA